MRQNSWRPEGQAAYRRRKAAVVEPVFGRIKERRGFRGSLFRGLKKVEAEWQIICLTHNLLKLFRAGACPREVIETQELFCGVYGDRGTHSFVTPKAGERVDKRRLTQMGRAMKELGAQMIPAYLPQARDRVERNFGAWQGRLPQDQRLAGISIVEQANRFLRERHIAEFNRKFAVAAAEKGTPARRRPVALRHGHGHHEANSIPLNWPMTFLGLVIGRLYRVRNPHCGTHPARSEKRLCRLPWLALSPPPAPTAVQARFTAGSRSPRPTEPARSNPNRGPENCPQRQA